jgi:peptidoglycan hydrolase-like protein with peptidoglycan-binding domain
MGMQQFRAPALPLAPAEYDQQHMSQLIGALRLYFTQSDSNASLQLDGIRLLNLPTSGYNLPNGTVFRDGEYLKVVLPNIAYVEGVSGIGAVGGVTIVTNNFQGIFATGNIGTVTVTII